jgi:hypothetical protein
LLIVVLNWPGGKMIVQKMGLFVCFISIGAMLGCTDFRGRIAPHFSMEQVVDNVECELQEALSKYKADYPWLHHWAASFTITLKREDRGSFGPKVDYLNPDVFGIGASGEFVIDGIKTLTTKRTLLLRDLPRYVCKKEAFGSIMTGRLGLIESLGDSLRERGSDDVIGVEPDDLGYRIDFSIKAGGGISPSWILTRIPGAGFNMGASSETTHILDIAFSDATPKRPMLVEVTNFPRGGVSAPASDYVPKVRQGRSGSPPAITYRGGVSLDTRQRLDSTLQRLQLETLLPRR